VGIRTTCSNTECPKHTEYKGGHFIYSPERKAWFCDECFRSRPVLNDGRALWDFTTTHFNGEPIHVTSLAHLRQLEQQYGCSNHAANNMEKNWNSPPPEKKWVPPPGLAKIMQDVERYR
jgi:hypothetical protein